MLTRSASTQQSLRRYVAEEATGDPESAVVAVEPPHFLQNVVDAFLICRTGQHTFVVAATSIVYCRVWEIDTRTEDVVVRAPPLTGQKHELEAMMIDYSIRVLRACANGEPRDGQCVHAATPPRVASPLGPVAA